ncbi:MAG: cyanophycin synthetase [Planctomycetaceae bacterium]
MEIRRILTLRGPNIWSRHPVLEAWVDLQNLKDCASTSVPGFNDRLMSWLPTMIEHRCSYGERGGFFQRLRDGTYPAHILEHVTLELQTLAGTNVGFGKARETSEEGVFKVVMRYRDEQVARACLYAARDLVMAALHDQPCHVEAEVKRLRELADRVCLGPSTQAIVAAAESRGIPSRRLNAGSLVQLGQGVKQRRIWTAETDRTSAIAESIAQDKELTKTLLRAGGVPVPEGRAATDAADAWQAALEIGPPVVVKPRDANHARGVFINLTEQAEVESAYDVALREGSGVLVEKYAPGTEHRLLVVGKRLVAACRGEAASVVGDGCRTVTQLIDDQLNSDPRRGTNETCPLSPIEFTPIVLAQLERQGYVPESVPPNGASVLVQRHDILADDVTDDVHPTIAAHAVLAAQIVGLDIAGLDLVLEDITRPLEAQGGVVVEVNASPGLLPHLKPSAGSPRPVGEAIVDTLFPEGETGRVPIVCITGTNGKTTVARLTAHLLRLAGRVVGTTTTDGIDVGGRVIETGDCSGPRSARKVLMNPTVEAAVFEAARGGILREGLGFDKCDVAVVTNIDEADHLGLSYVDSAEQMFAVKRCGVDVVLPTGMAVLKADDSLVAEMQSLSAGAVTFFSLNPACSVVAAHRALGKRVAVVKEGQIVCAQGASESRVAAVADLPLTHQGRAPFQVENALAAVASAWALNVPFDVIRQGLLTFQGDSADNPGRFNRFDYRGATVIIDDCHNTSALKALVHALDLFPHERRTIVYSAGDARRNADIVRQGEQLAAAFDRVILYEDISAADRAAGELTGLFKQGLIHGGRVSEVIEMAAHDRAIAAALESAGPGELVVIQTTDDVVGSALAVVQSLAAGEDLAGVSDERGAARPVEAGAARQN